MATKREALLVCYQTINGPVKAGPIWVTYSRKQVDALLQTMKQILVEEGFEFRKPPEKSMSKVHTWSTDFIRVPSLDMVTEI